MGVRIKARIDPRLVYRRASPNQSARTAPVRGIVLHSTESHNRPGKDDLIAVTDYLCRSDVEASAHVVVDADGHSARIVRDKRKAWHAGAYNSQTLGLEQIGWAAQGKQAWREDADGLHEAARWIARWSLRFEVPIRRGEASGGRVTTRGVLTHGELGDLGGGHWDPGRYPLDHVLRLARAYKRALRARRRS